LKDFLKTKKTFMSARQIAIETKATLSSVNRKLGKLFPRCLEKKVTRVKTGRRPVRFFRYKNEM